MSSGKSVMLKMDSKGRIVIPAELRKEMSISHAVIAKTDKGRILLKPLERIEDPLEYLSSIKIRTKKTPVQMKREAEEAFK